MSLGSVSLPGRMPYRAIVVSSSIGLMPYSGTMAVSRSPGLMPYSGTTTFSKLLLLERGRMMCSRLLLERGRMMCPRLLLDLNSMGGSMPYSGAMMFSKLLEDSSESSLTLELEDFFSLELLETAEVSAEELVETFSSLEELLASTFLLELEDFSCSELLDESSSSSLEELLASAFLLELEDFSSLELDDFAFFELLETAFAEELVSMTVFSFSLSSPAAMVESPSQLAQKAAVNDSRTFFQCLCKRMLIIRPFLERNIQN